MKKFLLAIAASSLALGGCTTVGPYGSPVVVANQSKIDEQIGLTVTLAYTASARAAALAINTGLIKDPAAIQRIGQLDARAYAAVLAVRSAYQAGNSADYLSALSQAQSAIADLLAATKGN